MYLNKYFKYSQIQLFIWVVMKLC